MHRNERLIRRTYAAFAAGDLETVAECFAEDIVWHSLGHSRFSRDYVGREDLFGLFATLFEETGGSFRMELQDILANDERAVGLTTNRAERLGRSLTYDEAAVFRIDGGRVAEAWLFVGDQEAYAAFFDAEAAET